jgi:hypothetical protein
VAHYLNIKRQRIQAILRNNSTGDDEDIKYDMLMTWMKKVPRSANKVNAPLLSTRYLALYLNISKLTSMSVLLLTPPHLLSYIGHALIFPQTDILVSALMYGNRPDLVSELKDQENDFQTRRKSATGSRSARKNTHDRTSLRGGSARSVRE